MPAAGAGRIATATAGLATGGLKIFCGWTPAPGEAGREGVAARCFAFGFRVDVLGVEDGPLEGRELDDVGEEEGDDDDDDDESGELWLGATAGFVTGVASFFTTLLAGVGFGCVTGAGSGSGPAA